MSHNRILIVEDEALVAADIKDRLTRKGYRVVGVAETGEQAVASARELKPDLVLSDIRLAGEMDGIEAADCIRRELNTPVVFLTAHGDRPTTQRAEAADPFGYVLKPFHDEELQTAIEIAQYRHEMEQRVKQAERLLAATLSSIADGVIAGDTAGHITFLNRAAEELTGWSLDEVRNRDLKSVFLLSYSASTGLAESPVSRALAERRAVNLEHDAKLIARSGVHRPVDGSCAPIRDDHGRIVGTILVFRDISAQRQAEAKRDALVAQLQEALAHVKTLSGLLPICAWCKSIRNDQGYWEQLESYIDAHSTAQITHSICPKCREQLIPNPG